MHSGKPILPSSVNRYLLPRRCIPYLGCDKTHQFTLCRLQSLRHLILTFLLPGRHVPAAFNTCEKTHLASIYIPSPPCFSYKFTQSYPNYRLLSFLPFQCSLLLSIFIIHHLPSTAEASSFVLFFSHCWRKTEPKFGYIAGIDEEAAEYLKNFEEFSGSSETGCLQVKLDASALQWHS